VAKFYRSKTSVDMSERFHIEVASRYEAVALQHRTHGADSRQRWQPPRIHLGIELRRARRLETRSRPRRLFARRARHRHRHRAGRVAYTIYICNPQHAAHRAHGRSGQALHARREDQPRRRDALRPPPFDQPVLGRQYRNQALTGACGAASPVAIAAANGAKLRPAQPVRPRKRKICFYAK